MELTTQEYYSTKEAQYTAYPKNLKKMIRRLLGHKIQKVKT